MRSELGAFCPGCRLDRAELLLPADFLAEALLPADAEDFVVVADDLEVLRFFAAVFEVDFP